MFPAFSWAMIISCIFLYWCKSLFIFYFFVLPNLPAGTWPSCGRRPRVRACFRPLGPLIMTDWTSSLYFCPLNSLRTCFLILRNIFITFRTLTSDIWLRFRSDFIACTIIFLFQFRTLTSHWVLRNYFPFMVIFLAASWPSHFFYTIAFEPVYLL